MPEDYPKSFKEAVAVFQHARMFVWKWIIQYPIAWFFLTCDVAFNFLLQIWCWNQRAETHETSYTTASAISRWRAWISGTVSLFVIFTFIPSYDVNFLIQKKEEKKVENREQRERKKKAKRKNHELGQKNRKLRKEMEPRVEFISNI